MDTGSHDYAWLIFIILVETEFYHVGQAGLELLTSSDLPTSGSHSAVITGVSHQAWPKICFLLQSISISLAEIFKMQIIKSKKMERGNLETLYYCAV